MHSIGGILLAVSVVAARLHTSTKRQTVGQESSNEREMETVVQVKNLDLDKIPHHQAKRQRRQLGGLLSGILTPPQQSTAAAVIETTKPSVLSIRADSKILTGPLITTGLLTMPVATAISSPLMVIGNSIINPSLVNSISVISIMLPSVPSAVPSITTVPPAATIPSITSSPSPTNLNLTTTVTEGDQNSTSTVATASGGTTSTYVVLVTAAPTPTLGVLSSSFSLGEKVFSSLISVIAIAATVCLVI